MNLTLGNSFAEEGSCGLAWSPDGQFLGVAANGPGMIGLFDPTTGRLVRSLTGPSNSNRGIAFSPDGKVVISVGSDDVRAVDIATGQPRRFGKMFFGQSVAVNPSGTRIAAGSRCGQVRLFDFASGAGKDLRGYQDGYDEAINCLAFSWDGLTLAAGHDSGSILRWDVASGATLLPLMGHKRTVMSLAYSPDGRSLASGAFDSKGRIWDAVTGDTICTLDAPGEAGRSVVPAVAFSPDGRVLASTHPYRTTLLWSVETHQVLRIIDGVSVGSVGSTGHMAFSPDGKMLAVAHGVVPVIWLHDVLTGVTRELDLVCESMRALSIRGRF